METNEITDDASKYFIFEDEFKEALDITNLVNDDGQEALKWAFSFDPPIDESDHIKDVEGYGKMITTSGGVLIGKASFQMNADEFNIESFKLVESEKSPKTGIKINIDKIKSYQNQSTFRFEDKTASKDADLTDIKVSNGIKNEENPEESTYKEYKLTPEFNKEIKEYQITLLEYLDTIDITATQSDSKSNMKIKYPKRDADGNLIYEADGTTITYDEVNLADQTPKAIVLNKLGEADTEITVTVTAEDGKTSNEYKIKIHRPYGTIRGSIQLEDSLRDSLDASYGIYVKYVGTVTIYNHDEFDWDSILSGDLTYDDLANIKEQLKYNIEDIDNGTYEIKIIPGNYDIQIQSLGFLDVINNDKLVNEGDILDLGKEIMLAGDVNHDGYVGIEDIQVIYSRMDSAEGDGVYIEEADYGNKGYIGAEDISITYKRMDELITIK